MKDLFPLNLFIENSHRKLHGAYLCGADFDGATMIKTELIGANLSHVPPGAPTSSNSTHLNRANLRGAKLNSAKLTNAWFYEADLSGADFEGADLRGAHISDTNFKHVRNLTKSQLRSTRWPDNAKNVPKELL